MTIAVDLGRKATQQTKQTVIPRDRIFYPSLTQIYFIVFYILIYTGRLHIPDCCCFLFFCFQRKNNVNTNWKILIETLPLDTIVQICFHRKF